MPFEWFVALRYLREEKAQTALILAAVSVGVSVIVFLSALINGLQVSLIDRTLGSQPHVTVHVPREVPRPLVYAVGDRAIARDVQAASQRLRSIDQWPAVMAEVERGKADGVFITTTGVGELRDGIDCSGANARPGDVVLLSGPIGAHGMAIMACRENLSFDAPIVSDTAALHGLVDALLRAAPGLHTMRDATRGGVGATLNEIAQQSGVGIEIDEAAIPIPAPVEAACELLGLDPLYVANEGRLLAICPPDLAGDALGALRAHPLGAGATRIGRVIEDPRRFVQMRTRLGGRRIVDWLHGDQLPRIC